MEDKFDIPNIKYKEEDDLTSIGNQGDASNPNDTNFVLVEKNQPSSQGENTSLKAAAGMEDETHHSAHRVHAESIDNAVHDRQELSMADSLLADTLSEMELPQSGNVENNAYGDAQGFYKNHVHSQTNLDNRVQQNNTMHANNVQGGDEYPFSGQARQQGSEQGNGGGTGYSQPQFTNNQQSGSYGNAHAYSSQYEHQSGNTTKQMHMNENMQKNKKQHVDQYKGTNKNQSQHIFITSLLGALAGCVLFAAVFFGGQWLINSTKPQQPSTNSSSLVPRSATDSPLTEVIQAVSPGVVTVLVNQQQRGFFGSVQNVEGLGSGVVYHTEGNKVFIITNAHVVSGADEIAVFRNDLTRAELDIARVVDVDEANDIAVLALDSPKQKYDVTIDFANSDSLVLGEEVVAVGSPMGEEYSGTVTNGIISGLNRQVPVNSWGSTKTFIQTNAAINGGNSGGGLINMNGQLVGINSAKLNNADNIGFAIPSNTVLAVLATLKVPQPVVDWEFKNVDA